MSPSAALALPLLVFAPAQAQTPASDKPAVMAGRVLNAVSGEPIRRATVRCRPLIPVNPLDPPPFILATSDDEGRFRFEGLAAGRYQLAGEKAGFVPGEYGARSRSGIGIQIALSPGQTIDNLEFRLTPQAVVRGTVFDQDGEPVNRAQVAIARRQFFNGKWSMAAVAAQMTQDTGEFRFATLPPGRYYIFATAFPMPGQQANAPAAGPPQESYITTWHPDAPDLESSVPLDLAPGADRAGIDIRLRKAPTFVIHGRLEPVPTDRSRVMLVQKESAHGSMSSGSAALVRADGSFTISGVRPGSYWAVATTAMGMLTPLGRAEIEVTGQNIDSLVIRRQRPGRVTGVARLESAGPAASFRGIYLSLLPIDGPSFGRQPVTPAEDGSFTIPDITPDRYRLSVGGAPAGAYLKSVRTGGQDVLESGFMLSDDSAVHLEVAFATDSASVRGVAVNRDGAPVPGAIISLTWSSESNIAQLRSRTLAADQQGRFSLENIAPGTYLLHAWEDLDRGANHDPALRKKVQPFAREITLKPREQAEVSLTLIPAAETVLP